MLDALQADEVVREVMQLGGLAAESEYLEAEPFVEVHVQRRENACLVVVPGGDEPLRQLPLSVGVDEGQARDRIALPLRLLVLDEGRAHQVADGLGAVREAAFAQPAVEARQERLLDGEADALEFRF